MNKELKQKIIEMIELAKPTQEQTDRILYEWDKYFNRLLIGIEDQETEFDSIMRMRVHSGCISCVAPDMDKMLKQENK